MLDVSTTNREWLYIHTELADLFVRKLYDKCENFHYHPHAFVPDMIYSMTYCKFQTNKWHILHLRKTVCFWAMPCENMSLGICRQPRPRSDCASAQSDQGLHCLQTKSLDTIECFSGEQMPTWNLVHAQNDLNLHILHMFKGTFSLDAAQLRQ